MKIKGKKLIRISNVILILFIFMSAVSFAYRNDIYNVLQVRGIVF